MATNYTRFEIVLPVLGIDTPQERAVADFLNNMRNLCNVVSYSATIRNMDTTITQQTVIYGLITTAQQATALGYLNTLNTALGTQVLCTTHIVTQQP